MVSYNLGRNFETIETNVSKAAAESVRVYLVKILFILPTLLQTLLYYFPTKSYLHCYPLS